MSEPEKPIHFFVDAKRYDTDKKHLTGAQIKAKANAPAEYQLFLEEEGDKPDKPIPDSHTVDMTGETKHFFAVPPATFGMK